MSKINDEFMEAYKRIDHFCKDALGTDKGVTSYIDEMREKTDGYKYVPGWKDNLDSLVKYRHMRNNYSHEIGSSYSDICEWDDVFWLREFYQKLLNVKDPLSIYSLAKNPIKNKHNTNVQEIKTYDYENSGQRNEPKHRKKRLLPIIGIILILIVLIALTAVVLGIAFIIVT